MIIAYSSIAGSSGLILRLKNKQRESKRDKKGEITICGRNHKAWSNKTCGFGDLCVLQ